MIQNAHIGTLFKSAAIVCLVLSHVSCVEENELASLQPITKSDVVTFGINMSNQWEPDVIGDDKSVSTGGSAYTRSATLPMDCDSDMPEEKIYMYMVEEDIPSVVDTTKVESRNAVEPEIGIFAIHTVENGNKEDFMENISLSGYGKTDGTAYQYWPGYGTLKFYAYTPYVGLEDEGTFLLFAGHQPKFSYTVPVNVDEQKDLMDGVSEEYNGDPFSDVTSSSEVSINLKHSLSQVQVKVGNIPSNGEVTSIQFTDIYTTGTKNLGDDNWTVIREGQGIIADYKQPYEEGETLTLNDEKALEQPFYMMPQTFLSNATHKAKIEVNLKLTSTSPTNGNPRTKEYPLSKDLEAFGTSWEPDKKYTYVITTPEEVEVKVDDEVNGNIKSGLKIQNTGLADAYIRVAIFGSWVVQKEEEKVFFAVWSEEEDGKFSWGATGSKPTTTETKNNWRLGEDGYYYYMKKVERNETLQPLFSTYTLTADAPTADAYLELSIMAQAVSEEDYGLVWPEDIKNAFGSQN